MHEHDSVHELNLVSSTGLEHLFDVAGRHAAWLFDEHMLSRLGGPDDPIFADGGG